MMRSTFGTIEKRGTNSYRIRWTDRDGTRRSESVKGTRHAAQLRLAEIQSGAFAPARSRTYSAYWEDTVRPSMSTLAPKTVHDYTWTWEARLAPAIGSMRVSDTDWRTVQRIIDTIAPYGTQRKCFVLWRKVCNMAMRDRLLDRNPCDRSIRLMQRTRREKVLVDAEYVHAWLDGVQGFKHEAAVLCMLGGGLRPEEARALLWEDIEPWTYRGTTYAAVDVSKTVVFAGTTIEQSSTKTATSDRTVVIGAPFAERLLELADGRHGRICDNGRGGCTSPQTMARNWKAWSERHGMVFVTCENLRSSYATLHGEAGSIDSLVALSMGHSDGTTKGENYQKSTMRGMALIADNLAEHLGQFWD